MDRRAPRAAPPCARRWRAIPPRKPCPLMRWLAHRARPEVVRHLIHQRRHHFGARICVPHAAANPLLGDAYGTELPARPARRAPDARAAGGLEEPRRHVAANLGAHAALHLGNVGDLHVHARLRIGDVAEEDRGHAILLADFAQRRRVEPPRAHRCEQRLALAELNEARARLCRLDLLLELPRGARADGALGVRVELDDADAAVAPEVDARWHRNHHSARTRPEQCEGDEQADADKSIHCMPPFCWFAGRQPTPAMAAPSGGAGLGATYYSNSLIQAAVR